METAANCLSYVKWEEEDYYISDFVHKLTLPQIVKITKGQHSSLGNPIPPTTQLVLFVETVKQVNIVAQCVKFKNEGRVIPVGSKISIPNNYEGWFEILSEDGKAARCIESVADLYRIRQKKCLVRKNIKAYLAKSVNSENICDKTRTLYAGETLVIMNDIFLVQIKSKYPVSCLKCITDKDEIVYLSVDQKGKFSPIVEGNHIAGVHSIRNLSTMKFPLMVRLVDGKSPNGLKSSQFTKEMRLYTTCEEESIAVLPLSKDSNLVSLPLSAPLKVQVPKNWDTLMNLNAIVNLVQKSQNIVREASNEMQLFDISLSKSHLLKQNSKNFSKENKITRRVSNSDSSHIDESQEKVTIHKIIKEVDSRYDEIDQIYDYVRGISPLLPEPREIKEVVDKKSSLKSNSMNCSSQAQNSDSSKDKPVPPPIETIPVRVLKPNVEYQCLINQNEKAAFSSSEFDTNIYHVYETIRSKRMENFRNNRPKRFLSHPSNCAKKFLPSPAQQRIRQKSTYVKNPLYKDESWQCPKTIKKPLLNSSIFNLRYKSLGNLDSKGDDFKNPEQPISQISQNSVIGRSKSLGDIFEDKDNFVIQRNTDNFTNRVETRKLVLSHDFLSGRLLSDKNHKKVGFMYL